MAQTANEIATLVTLKPETCCSCGVAFGMPADLKAQRLKDHQWFYCPNGHQQYYAGQSEAEKLRDELAREKHWREQETARLRDQLSAEEYSHRATRGVVTKLRKRAAAGCCPCCTRTFTNLARHMKSKHPHYAEAPVPA